MNKIFTVLVLAFALLVPTVIFAATPVNDWHPEEDVSELSHEEGSYFIVFWVFFTVLMPLLFIGLLLVLGHWLPVFGRWLWVFLRSP